MATTYNFTDGSVQPYKPLPQVIERDRITPVKNIVDFSKQPLDAGEDDVAQAIAIPANVTVLFCSVLPVADGDGNLAGTNATVDIGYGGDADAWGAGIVLDTKEYNVASTGGAAPTYNPVYFASADTIDLTATADDADVDISAGRAEVTAYCIRH